MPERFVAELLIPRTSDPKVWFFMACVAGAWKKWAKERMGARKGDTQGVRERMHGRPPKIVSTRIL